ncbi:unnamed protein product [Closterium sp. NIES-53]
MSLALFRKRDSDAMHPSMFTTWNSVTCYHASRSCKPAQHFRLLPLPFLKPVALIPQLKGSPVSPPTSSHLFCPLPPCNLAHLLLLLLPKPMPSNPLPPATFVPLSRDSRPRREQVWLIAFLTTLVVLCALCLIPALLPSPGPSMLLVALSYARISVAVVVATPLVWGVNSLTVLLPARVGHEQPHRASPRSPRARRTPLLRRRVSDSPPPAAALLGLTTMHERGSHRCRCRLIARRCWYRHARCRSSNSSSRNGDGWSIFCGRRHGCRSLSLSHCQHQQRMAARSQPPRVSTPFRFPRPALLLIPLFLQLRTAHLPTGHPLSMLILLCSRPLKRLSLSLLRHTASLLLSHSQSILYFFLLLLLLQVLVTAPLAAGVRKLVTVCPMGAEEGKIALMCHAWLLLLLWLSAQPLVLLLGLWAIVVLLLVAALVGHRDDIHRGKHAVESAVGGDAAAAYPAIASAGGIAAVAAVPTHAALPVHVPRVPSATGITSQPRLSQLRGHLPLLAQALRSAPVLRKLASPPPV